MSFLLLTRQISPLWVFIITVVIVLVAIRCGKLLGRRTRRKSGYEADSSIGTVIGAALGLLAFMLAFTFGSAANRLETRKQLFLDEINAVETAYLRAGLLVEPYRSDTRQLLRQYIDIQANMVGKPPREIIKQFPEIISRLETLEKQMWVNAVAATELKINTGTDPLFINSLNQMIEVQNSRVTVIQYSIPVTIWYALYFITILSMGAVGYQFGLSGKSSLRVVVVLAFIFSAVVGLIVDLDRATGSMHASPKPLLDLQKRMLVPWDEAVSQPVIPDNQASVK